MQVMPLALAGGGRLGRIWSLGACPDRSGSWQQELPSLLGIVVQGVPRAASPGHWGSGNNSGYPLGEQACQWCSHRLPRKKEGCWEPSNQTWGSGEAPRRRQHLSGDSKGQEVLAR